MVKNKSFLALLLLVALCFSTLASAEVPEACREVVVYDQMRTQLGQRSDFLKSCRGFLDAMQAAQQKVQLSMQRSQPLAVRGTGAQAESFQEAANVGLAGGAEASHRMQVAQEARRDFQVVVSQVNDQSSQLARESNAILAKPDLAEPDKAKFNAVFEKAKQALVRVRDDATRRAATAQQFAQTYQARASQLSIYASTNESVAGGLGSGVSGATGQPPPEQQSRGGVSTGTLVGLGGAALITAGAVGGLYYVTQQGIKSTNKAAEARLVQADTIAQNRITQVHEVATDVIKKAEDSATRIIELSTNSANQVLANGEATANRIIDKAKVDAVSLAGTMRSELDAAFKTLTTERVKELRAELDTLFDNLIVRATQQVDVSLVTKLQNLEKSITDQIDAELARRGTTLSTITTSTATAVVP